MKQRVSFLVFFNLYKVEKVFFHNKSYLSDLFPECFQKFKIHKDIN